MKAIVLTYDKNHDICDHMIHCYQKKWSKNPFIFRVPYQKYPHALKEKYGSKIELVQTPQDIRSTIMYLLQDLPDDEWIYWCMDDYYLVSIKEKKVTQIYEWIQTITDTNICGILFNRYIRSTSLEFNRKILSLNQQFFIERNNFQKIWNHQFLRVKVLKYFFDKFPEGNFDAHATDEYKDNLKKLEDQKLYVSEENLVILGESTRHGKLTMNCIDSLKRYKFKIPEGRGVYHKNYRFQGRFLHKNLDIIRIVKNKYF